jgi:hypothetical protein
MLKRVLILSLLLVFTVADSTWAGTRDEYPEYNAWLEISSAVVDLGPTVPDPSGTGEYLEVENALLIMFQCGQEGQKWQVELAAAGGDFFSGTNSIRLNRMWWKVGDGNYRPLPPAGQPCVLAKSMDYRGNETGLHTLMLSFRLYLPQDEPAGDYISTINVTMCFW